MMEKGVRNTYFLFLIHLSVIVSIKASNTEQDEKLYPITDFVLRSKIIEAATFQN